MAGNTGKMTRDAVLERGPRMQLIRAYSGTTPLGFVVMGGRDSAIGLGVTKIDRPSYRTYAESYTLGYLLRIGRAQQ
jgi:hypothetical protein